MEIIKRGYICKDKFELTCGNCNSILLVDKKDLLPYGTMWDAMYYYSCPVCNEKRYVTYDYLCKHMAKK